MIKGTLEIDVTGLLEREGTLEDEIREAVHYEVIRVVKEQLLADGKKAIKLYLEKRFESENPNEVNLTIEL